MADLDQLLLKTSRTFALSIPLLPEPTRREVTIAYLLFRIADTLEDAVNWSVERKQDALAHFIDLLAADRDPPVADAAASWTTDPPLDHAGYLELLAETPAVLVAFRQLAPAARSVLREHLIRTAEGMSAFVGRGGDRSPLRLETLQDLRDYCYIVAGIVGEMLTHLYVQGRAQLEPRLSELHPDARYFGEGLQLVNILKDSATDLTEGRCYLPPAVSRTEVLALARSDLERAGHYISVLQDGEAPRGILAFNLLPVMLARATLDRVEECGPGSKLTRQEVFDLLAAMNRALDAGRAVSALGT
jgi:farnesyl-diphosphate farnesyltransferase